MDSQTPHDQSHEGSDVPAVQPFWKRMSKPRLVLLAIVVLVGLALVLTVLGALSSARQSATFDLAYAPMMESGFGAPASNRMAYDADMVRTSYPAKRGGVGSFDESAFESLAYRASFEKGEIETLCDDIEGWKPLAYVVFLYTDRTSKRCAYQFKVERAHAPTVLASIEALDPEEVRESISVLKKQLSDHTSQLDVLLQKQTLLESSLQSATAAYNELVELSKDAQDVETLSKVIDSKLRHIESLSNQRITLAQQIDNIAKSKAELTDRIDYVYFVIDVSKTPEIFDGDAFKQSWIYELRMFVSTANNTLQDLTVGLGSNLLMLIKTLVYVLLYLVVIVVVGKYAWRAGKKFWQS